MKTYAYFIIVVVILALLFIMRGGPTVPVQGDPAARNLLLRPDLAD